MARIQPIDIDRAEGKAKSLLENVNKALGVTPNLMRTLAHSPATLEAYLGFGKALGGGSLSAQLREQIAIATANANACEYCTSAHTALAAPARSIRAHQFSSSATSSFNRRTIARTVSVFRARYANPRHVAVQ